MSTVLHESKQQQVVALGRLGWSRRAGGAEAAPKSGHHGRGVHRDVPARFVPHAMVTGYLYGVSPGVDVTESVTVWPIVGVGGRGP